MNETFIKGNAYLWLLKPTELNRGRGIYLFKDLVKIRVVRIYLGTIRKKIYRILAHWTIKLR